jgi:hypothetical protein
MAVLTAAASLQMRVGHELNNPAKFVGPKTALSYKSDKMNPLARLSRRSPKG